jgi:pimeloyl-ACP methyl ester carboxylesterase
MSGHLLPCIELGQKNGDALVFLSGWPDDQLSACAPLVDKLKATHRILAICMPDLELKGYEAHRARPWGYSFAEIDTMLDDTIVSILGKDTQFTLVIHDWGSVYGTIYQNNRPERVSRVVMMDVGLKKELSPYDALVILLYQWWFTIAYIVSQVLGNFIGNIVLKSFFLFGLILPFLTVGSSGKAKLPRPVDDLSVHMCYPYYQFWKSKLTMKKDINMRFPTCPLLYLVNTFYSRVFYIC